jgi:hypothetical protein
MTSAAAQQRAAERSTIGGDASFRLAADVFVQRTADEAILIALAAENVFALNLPALHIVDKLTAGLSIDTVVDELSSEFEESRDRIAADVRELIVLLVERQLLVPERS